MTINNTCGSCKISYTIEWHDFAIDNGVENDDHEIQEPLICPFCAIEIGDEYTEDYDEL
jgi:hypothetical protein